MKKRISLFIILACMGITTEVFFTAITSYLSGAGNIRLQGNSYIWMFPVYGSASILFPPAMRLLHNIHPFLRALIYGAGILVVEFIAGAFLELTTGVCPWKYTHGMHVMGFIRLDYFPFWAVFGYLLENIIQLFDSLLNYNKK